MIFVLRIGSGPRRAGPAKINPALFWGKDRSDKPGNGLDICKGQIHILPTNYMADIANRYGDNVPGKFYVDNQCIDCDLCRETAPDNFTRSDDGGYSFVYKQPGSPEEEARCKEAMEGCPVEAIGNNGDGA